MDADPPTTRAELDEAVAVIRHALATRQMPDDLFDQLMAFLWPKMSEAERAPFVARGYQPPAR